MQRKYFGTDGIRGRANRFPITPDLALRVGMAAGHAFRRGDHLVIPTVLPCKLTQSFGLPARPRVVHSVISSKEGSRSIRWITHSSPSGWTARSVGIHSRDAPPARNETAS
jgi:hypothetical protein